MTDPATITIDSIVFSKSGSIEFIGTVEGQEIVLTITSDTADFDKFLPGPDARPGELRDSDDLFNATLNSYDKTLHWFVVYNKHLYHYTVDIEPIIEDFLINAYQNL